MNLESVVFEIIGRDEIGDKSGTLFSEEKTLTELGLYVPDVSTFSLSLIDEVIQYNGLGNSTEDISFSPDLEERLDNLVLPQSVNDGLETVSRRFKNKPLAVRSDGVGESRGHGTYKTRFVSNRHTTLQLTFTEILKSYFTEEAFRFRAESSTPQRFGMQFMPIVGQKWSKYQSLIPFAPLLSGVAYTSRFPEDAHIKIELGLCGAVDSRNALKITSREIQRAFDSEHAAFSRVVSYVENKPKWAEKLRLYEHNQGLAWVHRKGDILTGRLSQTQLYQRFSLIGQRLSHMDLKGFFDSLEKLEKIKGCPQYLEMAFTTNWEGYGKKFYITQISSMPDQSLSIHFEDDKKSLLYGNCLIGNQNDSFTKLIYCDDETQLGNLMEFNRHNKDYVIVYSNRISSKGYVIERERRGLDPDIHLRPEHCSNARGFIEEQDGRYSNDPEDHVLNKADMTGRFFGIIDPSIDLKDIFHNEGLRIRDGNYTALASRRDKKFQILEK